MPLRLAFIAYNEAQTRWYFKEFRWVNRDQVEVYSELLGKILLKDGTIIQRVPASLHTLDGLHFDQIIVARDRRGEYVWSQHRIELLHELMRRMTCGRVPAEYAVIYYDLDSEEDNL